MTQFRMVYINKEGVRKNGEWKDAKTMTIWEARFINFDLFIGQEKVYLEYR